MPKNDTSVPLYKTSQWSNSASELKSDNMGGFGSVMEYKFSFIKEKSVTSLLK